ncbi:MAG: T9SS type A sorting domain-containing protein [Chlorobiota bacterium]
MKKILLLIFLMSIIALSAKNEIVVKQNVQSLFNHGDNEGKIFFVAFPYNDSKNHPTQNIAIYVTSRFDTEVTLYIKEINLKITKSVKKGEITEFSSAKGGMGWDSEIYEFEKVVGKGIRITSKDPVKVYALNSKSVSSEGYMAAPLRKWGTDYIHNGFYDFDEVREWGGGFVVLASEDYTEVNIKLVDGVNHSAGFGETTGGKQHGDSITITMNSGDVYAVQGTGTTRGIFDLSGSKITSNKPIALLSYHNRTMIPATVVTSGRDHIIEMIPPVDSWGTEYHSLELDRGKDKGDYFRVIAGEDDVTFDIVWYDKVTKEKISDIGPITLQEKGNWFEYNGEGVTMPHFQESIRGVAHFKADGPILVSQYAYSANYDGAGGNFDPFMIVLPAVGQYTKDCIFQTPQNYGNNEFRNNFVSIIAKGDPKDSVNNYSLLSSLELDGLKLIKQSPSFETDNIPNTDYYWVFVRDLNAGAHELKGDTEFGATIYGYASFDSYGWSVTHNVDDLVNTDTTSPRIETIADNYKYVFKVSDIPIDAGGLNGLQSKEYSVGLNLLPKLKSGSFNFTEPKLVDEFGDDIYSQGLMNQKEYYFSVEIIDKAQDATAILQILDKNYNETELSIEYGAITSIEDSDTRGVRILDPQPIAGNRLNIELTDYINRTITISDIEGNILRTVEANDSQISIDISDLSSGAYFINISDGKTQVTKKFMIER